MFCDIVGVDRPRRGARPRAAPPDVIHGYFDAMRATIERYGGTVQKFAGDAVLAVFGVPRCARMTRCGRSGPRRRSGADAVGRRGVGVGCTAAPGSTLAWSHRRCRTLAMGDPVNVAARLEQAAPPGEILLGPETLRLVRDAVEVDRSRRWR